MYTVYIVIIKIINILNFIFEGLRDPQGSLRSLQEPSGISRDPEGCPGMPPILLEAAKAAPVSRGLGGCLLNLSMSLWYLDILGTPG